MRLKQERLDDLDRFRHPLWDVGELEQALPVISLFDQQAAHAIHKDAGAILLGHDLEQSGNRVGQCGQEPPADLAQASDLGRKISLSSGRIHIVKPQGPRDPIRLG